VTTHRYLDYAEEMLREKHGLDADFHFFNFQSVPEGAYDHTQMQGAICLEKFKSGPRKGRFNIDKAVLGSFRTFIVSDAAVAAYAEAWAKKTGKCKRCRGDGREVVSAGMNGTKYRACPECGK
jgi:hypothetical protein